MQTSRSGTRSQRPLAERAHAVPLGDAVERRKQSQVVFLRESKQREGCASRRVPLCELQEMESIGIDKAVPHLIYATSDLLDKVHVLRLLAWSDMLCRAAELVRR
jgi:hypothetical protein